MSRKLLARSTALFVLLAVTSTIERRPAAEEASRLILEHATVIDGTGAPPKTDQTIVIEGDRIVAIGAMPAAAREPGGTRLDLTGKVVMPGLIDMHAHMAFGPVEASAIDGVPSPRLTIDERVGHEVARELLRWGVTTVRNPGGPTRESIAIRDAIASGRLPGPRIVTAGAIVDRMPFEGLTAIVRTADDVVAEVARQADAKVDFIKLYAGLTPDLVKAGIDAAHARGLKAVGHLWLTDWKTAADAGIDGLVHALPLSDKQLPEAARAAYLKGITGTQAMYQWYEHADVRGAEMRAAFRAMADHRVTFDPTLVAVESIFFGDDPALTAHPSIAHVPESTRTNWRTSTLTTGWTAEDYRRAKQQFGKALALVGEAYRAGVPIAAGTDLSMPWVIPGEGLHRELELLVKAGLTPLDAIAAATGNAGRGLGAEHRVGTIAVGQRADLVVVNGNPAVDIRETRSIVRVFQGGKEIARP